MVEAFLLAAGGTLLAGREALRTGGVGFNIGGGFHHAFPGHGEGFCAIHDVAVAIRVLQREGVIARAMVVDVDVHHGNGTAAIFAGDPQVFTISIHQRDNYPQEKPPSSIDIHLDDFTRDAEYLEKFALAYVPSVGAFAPDVIFYVAGADPYFDDQLGGLSLTAEGLLARDELVFRTARKRGIPVMAALAGGYARNLPDTVMLHVNTARAALSKA
jgi:acetoin utilization deacetylase AcuC-like enzyme